jgi:REP element-mobilizing transposase RayT
MMNLPAHAEKVETIAAFSSADPLRPGSARASRAVSGASPETRSEAWYSKRRLPHFERPWEKYAIAFSTCERRPLSPRERDIVLRSAVHAHEHGQCELYVACVMPDHVHLLLEPQIKGDMDGKTFFWSLSEILHGIKSSTAHRINKHRAETGPVWEKESFDRLIRSETDLQEKFQYTCRNPWDSHVVVRTEYYPWLWTQEKVFGGGAEGGTRGRVRSPDKMMAPRRPS